MQASLAFVAVDLAESGVVPRVLDSFTLSLRTGGGACNTCAAVGVPCPFPLGNTPFGPGLRAGGVMDPARTGNSSAFGTLCLTANGFFSARTPFTPWLFLTPCGNRGRPGSMECERLGFSVPFCWRGEFWFVAR